MSQLFGLESFVYQQGSRKDDYSDDFELLSEVKRLLKDSEQANKKRNIVLFGESGAGKSLFVIKLMQEILKDGEFNNHLIVFFKLRDLSGENSTDTQLSKL
jgi:DNA replication protein DnaC